MIQLVRDRQEWEAIHDRLIGDKLFASYEWVKASEAIPNQGRAEAAVFTIGNTLLFHPYLVRNIPGSDEYQDLVSPYEFGGVWFSTEEPGDIRSLLAHFAQGFPEIAAKCKYVSSFQRLDPFQATADWAEFLPVTEQQDHIFVDLGKGYETVSSGYRYATRKQLAQAERAGLRFDPTSDLNAFIRLYHRNMAQLGAAEFYRFPKAFFERIFGMTKQFSVLTAEGEVCARHLYALDGETMWAFLCHHDRRFDRVRPNNFAYDRAIRWGIENGFKRLHLGGGHQTLFAFKSGFSRNTVPYYQMKWVVDSRSYEKLCSGKGIDHNDDHFPAYRRAS